MLVGFAMAMVAGFSLTAVATWTGRRAVHGAPLGLLVLCWLAGRLAMAWSNVLPGFLVATIDMLFPALLAVLLGREIIAGKSRRNYLLIVIITAMAGLNACFHLAVNGILPGGERVSLHLLIHAVLLLVTLIAGRIIPAFTANWLRQKGEENLPEIHSGLDQITLLLTLATGLSASFIPMNPATGVLAFTAMLVHLIRLSRWRGLATVSNPLLFVMHAAYAWLPVSLVLRALEMQSIVSSGAAVHAFTVGTIASLMVAMMMRSTLGHTGRPLVAGTAEIIAFVLLQLSAIVRALASSTVPGVYREAMIVSGVLWTLAFAVFLYRYWPILTRPRIDGRPG